MSLRVSTWKELAKRLGTKLLRNKAYYSKSNGMVKRFRYILKAVLRAVNFTFWLKVLLIVLRGIRKAWKEDLCASSVEMLYGPEIRHTNITFRIFFLLIIFSIIAFLFFGYISLQMQSANLGGIEARNTT